MLPPASSTSWNYGTAAHFLSRAAFGGNPEEVERLVKLGRNKAIAALFPAPPAVAPPVLESPALIAEIGPTLRDKSFDERKVAQKTLQKQNQLDLSNIREWWMHQMIRPEAAAREKAVLFWHGHFATSVQKVKDAAKMWTQNQLFRTFAFGDFSDMVKAISCDPAMVIWLDLQQSKNGAPNENFARELMELFTLGIGNYTEEDIKNSARAFTGYRTRRFADDFEYQTRQHDNQKKAFMGKTGYFGGDDIIDIILQQPACARFIATKIWTFYVYENPEPEIIDSLSATLRSAKYQLRPLFSEMFNSAAFYSEKALGTQIKSPVQLVAQTCRSLECDLPKTFPLQNSMRQLGQVLFAPPNVKGWDGNRAWINTATLDARVDLTDGISGVNYQRRGLQVELPLENLVTDHMINNPEALVAGLSKRLLSVELPMETRGEIVSTAEKYPKPLTRTAVREMLCKIMRLPEFQLC